MKQSACPMKSSLDQEGREEEGRREHGTGHGFMGKMNQ